MASAGAGTKAISSPRNTYRSTRRNESGLLANDGSSLLGVTDVIVKGKHQPVQSMAHLPTAMGSTDSKTALNGQASQRTLKTTTQWYLKSPAKSSFYDQAYKVVPTLNHGQRVNKLDRITKEN